MTAKKESYKKRERPVTRAQVIIIVAIAAALIVATNLNSERRKKSILEQEMRKRTNELWKSEAVYRSLVESTEDSIYLVDKDCQYLFMNEKHLSRLGLPVDKTIGRTYGELHSPEETKELVELVNQVFETDKSMQHEHRSQRDNKYFLRTLSPVKEPDGRVVAATVISKDITALKQTENDLIETKEYLDDIINSSVDTITVVDTNGIVRDWNKGAEGIMGYRADEVIGKSNSIFFTDPEEADRIMEQVQKEGAIKNYRTITLRKDGMPVHISMSAALLKDKDGVPTGSVRVSRDITKVVELEKRIKEERDNLNVIFESMVDAVYIVSKDYEIEFMNKVLIDEVGDQIGDICYKAFHDREGPCPWCKSSKVMAGKTVRWEWYSRRMNKTYDLVETPLTNIDGTISKLTIFRDITDRKRLEEERICAGERQLQLLDELEKTNAELKDFAYIVSHDLKAPLRAITSLATWISTDYGDMLDEEGKEQLDLLLNRVKQMHNLIESILQYSRIGHMKENKQETNLSILVSDVIKMIDPPEEVVITVEDKLPTILCDRTWMEQIFQNLMSNAVRYMDKPNGQITIGCTEESGYWKFSVADNGPGIESRYYDKIFQIFQTLKPRDEVESTGIGLSIVKKIVESQRGKIWVHSKVGVGSTFFFTVPKEENEL